MEQPVATEAGCACVCHVQQGPISEKADEPDTLIIGDSTIKDINGKKIKTCYFPDVMVSDINQKLATIILENPKISDYCACRT